MDPYTLTFETRPGYLFAHVRAASIDAESLAAYGTEVADKCDELECERVMILREIPVAPGTVDVYHASTNFTRRMAGKRVAYVNPYPEIEPDFQFALTVAVNRGGEAEMFRTEEEAEIWLLK